MHAVRCRSRNSLAAYRRPYKRLLRSPICIGQPINGCYGPEAVILVQTITTAGTSQKRQHAALEDARVEEAIISLRQSLLEALNMTKPDLPSSLCRLHSNVTWIQFRFCYLLVTKAARPKYDWCFVTHLANSPLTSQYGQVPAKALSIIHNT